MLQCRTDAASRLARGREVTTFTVALLAALALAGCSTAQIDAMPKELGGLPEGAPRRSENPPAYPAVHDLPPPRSKELMDTDQQKRLEADLAAARTRLQNQQKTKGKDAAGDRGKDAKKPAPERAAAQSDRPTVKRGRRPTALSEDNPPPGRPAPAVSARQAPAAPANPPAAGNAPAWPAPPGPDATGFGRNP